MDFTHSRAWAHLHLFFTNPVDYLFWFLYAKDGVVEMYEYDPKSDVIVEKVRSQIAKKFPELTLNYVGSSSLRILDERELDLYVNVNASEFGKYVPAFKKMFGTPIDDKPDFIQWYFPEDEYMVDVSIIDPARPKFQKELKSFLLLKNNPKLREEYSKIKRDAQGGSLRKFQFRKVAFLSKLKRMK